MKRKGIFFSFCLVVCPKLNQTTIKNKNRIISMCREVVAKWKKKWLKNEMDYTITIKGETVGNCIVVDMEQNTARKFVFIYTIMLPLGFLSSSCLSSLCSFELFPSQSDAEKNPHRQRMPFPRSGNHFHLPQQKLLIFLCYHSNVFFFQFCWFILN